MDSHIAMQSDRPMTVGEIFGEDWVEGDSELSEALEDLVGQAPKSPSGSVPPAGVSDRPAWQKYVDLASQFIPAVTTGIAEVAKPGSTVPPVDSDVGKTPQSTSFLTQDAGPLPVWGWGVLFIVAGGGLLYWMKRKP